jgi:hypothetical protein
MVEIGRAIPFPGKTANSFFIIYLNKSAWLETNPVLRSDPTGVGRYNYYDISGYSMI